MPDRARKKGAGHHTADAHEPEENSMIHDDATRAEYIAGLRWLADILAGDPGVPLPLHGDGVPLTVYVDDDAYADVDPPSPAAQVRGIACAMTDRVEHIDLDLDDGTYGYVVTGRLHGLHVHVRADRGICIPYRHDQVLTPLGAILPAPARTGVAA